MNIVLCSKTKQQVLYNLNLAKRLGNLKFANRLQCILLIAEKVSIDILAKIFAVTVRTIYNWLKLFILKKISGLRYKYSRGKQSKLTNKQKKELKELILKSPEENGYKTGIWTSSIIQEIIYKRFNIEYSVGYISQLLNSMDLSHKKVDTYCYKGDAESQKKWIEEDFPILLKRVKQENASLLFQDESLFRTWTDKAYSWGEKGKKIKSKISMDRDYRILIASIELNTGVLTCSTVKEFNKSTYLKYLVYLLKKYQGKKVFLVTDGSPVHSAGIIRTFLEKNKQFIELIKLPTYSPQFNPIEKIWKKIKQAYTHNRCFKNIQELEHALRIALIDLYDHKNKVLSVMNKYQNMFKDIIIQ